MLYVDVVEFADVKAHVAVDVKIDVDADVDGGGYVAFRGLDPRVDQDESHGQERDRQTTVSFLKF